MRKHGPAGRRRPARHCFNMVEIVLALGVIAVGVISILALFPIGLTASRDAMADSCGADAGDQMLHQLEYMIRLPGNWATAIAAIPSGYAGISTADFDFVANGTAVPNTQGTLYTKTSPVTPGQYKLVRYSDANLDGSYTAGEVVDFEAMVRVWQSQVTVPPGTTVPLTTAVRLNVELSWPAKLPYAQRQKSYYSKELFNRQ